MTPDYRRTLRRLTDGTLDPAAFGHRDHVGVAYEALQQGDFFEATGRVAAGIRALAARAGAPDKFNATITWAFMSLIAERMLTSDCAGAEDFIRRNPDLSDGSVLARWYSKRRLTSDHARAVALLPDIPEPRQVRA